MIRLVGLSDAVAGSLEIVSQAFRVATISLPQE